MCLFVELGGNFNFGGIVIGDESFFFDEVVDDVEGIVEGVFSFVEDESVGVVDDDWDGFVGGFVVGDFDYFVVRGLNFFNKVSGVKFVFSEVVNVGDGFVVGGFVDEFDFVMFNVFDDEDVEVLKEVEGEVVDGVVEDRFLNEENVVFGFFDFFDYVEEVYVFFFDDFIYLFVVVDLDGVFYLL